jgi:hypothetical protein
MEQLFIFLQFGESKKSAFVPVLISLYVRTRCAALSYDQPSFGVITRSTQRKTTFSLNCVAPLYSGWIWFKTG